MVKPLLYDASGKQVVKLAVAKSLKSGDNRVAVAPHNVSLLSNAAWNNGRDRTCLEVLVEEGAGVKTGYSDEEYRAAGAQVVSWETIAESAHILVDVKQRPASGVLEDGVNMFYGHVEKGQGADQLRALLERRNVTAYSPETFWLPQVGTGHLMRGTNLGFFSGVGAVHLLFEGIKRSYQLRGKPDVPFDFFPQVEGATADDIVAAYEKISERERSLRFAIIGGRTGLVSSGAQSEFFSAGIDYDLLYRDVTGDQDRLAEALATYDGIVNATVWNPGGPRLITRRQIEVMKRGAVFVDNTCDQDGSSSGNDEGDPVIGGVRFSFETSWGDSNMFYWVGPDGHTFNNTESHLQVDGTHVLYNTCGMVPGGTTTAKRASDAYFGMIFPYLTQVVRAISQGAELPENGLVVKDGKLFHEGLRELVEQRKDLVKFKGYL